MPIKVVIAEKSGKSWKLELNNESIFGKSIGDTIKGNEILPDLDGYELEITGGSDTAGFPMSKNVEGIGLKQEMFQKGWSMRDNYPGIRRRKTIRGKTISDSTSQLNLKIIKEGKKTFSEIFPDQNKSKEAKASEQKPAASN